MIFDAQYWKRDLKRLANQLRNWQTQRRWPRASFGSLEKSIMVGFYAIRRLLEAFQPMLPIERADLYQLTVFPSSNKRFSQLIWPNVHEHFDLAKPKTDRQPLSFICNQVIHSYVFAPWSDANGRLAGIFFSSDRKKHCELFRMEIEAIIKLFEQVAMGKGKWLLRFGPEKNRVRM